MHEGKIIKFYRERAELTQDQLGLGICSDTHISKIERGITDYSQEVLDLLCVRLGISMQCELAKFSSIKKRLYDWHDAIVKQLSAEMETIKSELEQEALLQISEYETLYLLLQAKYLLLKNQAETALRILNRIRKTAVRLPDFESNLFKHVEGLYHISKQNHVEAITILKTINDKEYNNPEYFHHLAMAYHTMRSEVMAYFYAEKARNFFKEINCFLRVIDAEMLMLIQVQDDPQHDFKEVIARFENLIQSCDMCNAPDRKAKIIHNLAYEYLRRKDYQKSSSLYLQSMELKSPRTLPYLLSLEGYLRSCFKGILLQAGELERLAQVGLTDAKALKDPVFILLFTMLLLLINGKEAEYYQYMNEEALPVFRKFGYVYLIRRSEQQLFHYYARTGNTEAALRMGHYLIEDHDIL
ncbi:helix-turn-helix domain-containing protein [Paenibacillus sp. CF384]|uniref:helix-turn-helix domain-containing protein n=1 Tax=Paenibacillus sp. CF384 TaxID=1884382 RepID=UPI00089A99E2|nr:helix-turn-helix transcriptional regulator [Paenibacillus sp. CF384]SDW95419.1 Helix-turn-helix [Paenibacillus sp. CF384]